MFEYLLSSFCIMLYLFWVIPQRLIYICRRFGTLYLFRLQRPLKMEQIECSETSAYINQTPGNHPKENKQHSEHGESLKSRELYMFRTGFLSIIRSLVLYTQQ